MDKETISFMVGIVGTLIGIAGLAYAVYENREAKRIKDVTRSVAWNLYRVTNNAGGETQGSLTLYKQMHSDKINAEVIQKISIASELSLTAYNDSIRFIQLAEPRFDLETIKYWHETGKIKDSHIENFQRIVVGGEPKSKNNPKLSADA